MVIKGINIRFDANKKLWWIILTGVTVATILIVITIVSFSKLPTSKITTHQEGIFYISQYEAEYEINVKSNKNSNHYKMKEWYLNKENKDYFQFQTQNEEGSNLCYVIADNTLKIKSEGQLNEYTLSNYIVKKENVLSLSTFLNLYNQIKEANLKEGFSLQVQEFEDKMCYSILFDMTKIKSMSETNEIVQEYNNIIQDGNQIAKMELIVSKETNLPIEYIIYNESQTAFIDILYNFFHINSNFDEKLFAF